MDRLNELWSRLAHLVGRRGFDDDLQAEIAFHIEERADELERSGMTRAEAVAAARRAFGSTLRARERSREPWRFRWLEEALLDARYAVRMLRRTPVFTLTALATLTLGIGATTAIFSIVDAAILRPLPYPDPDRLVSVSIEERVKGAGSISMGPDGAKPIKVGTAQRLSPSVEDVRDWQADGKAFTDVAIWRNAPETILDGREPQRASVTRATDGYLGVFGVAPLVGRGFSASDVVEGAPPVVLLGYGFWQSRFAGDRGVVGRTVRIDNEPATVIGVLPAWFHRESQLWRPFITSSKRFADRGSGTTVYGRLRPGVDLAQAQRALCEVTARLDRARGRDGDATVRLESLYERTVAGYGRITSILAAAVVLILLIACANVAGLLLARGTARRPELAIRASIGAGRARLVRQLLTESAVLALLGGAGGLLLARLSLDVLVANVPMVLPANSPVSLNSHVIAFAAALSLATSALFGLLPAVRLSGVRVAADMARVGARHGSTLSRRGGQALIAIEIALAVVLVSGAALMTRSFARLLAVDVGFAPAAFVAMDVVPVSPDPAVHAQYYPAFVRSLRNLPGVESAGAADNLPLAGGAVMTLASVEGQRVPLSVNQFLPGYFETIGARLKAGRFPSDADRTATPSSAVLTERAAAAMFPGARSLVGRTFQALGGSFQVAGVVEDIRHWGPSSPAPSEAFVAYGSTDARPLTVVVRPRRGAQGIGEQLRHAAQASGTRVVVDRIRSGAEMYSRVLVTPRQRTVLLALFGSLGMLLALVGVFGVTAYAVARRTREFGVRIALGAGPRTVVREALRDSLWPAAVGLAGGLAASLASTRVIESFLFETRPTDPATLAAVAAGLALAASVAAFVPARRAARVDPVTVLRAE